jgi:hypothetical protein
MACEKPAKSAAAWEGHCARCERHRDALYLPPGQDELSCRRCSDLTHRSTQDCGKHRSLFRLLASRHSCRAEDVDDLFREREPRDRPPLHPRPAGGYP